MTQPLMPERSAAALERWPGQDHRNPPTHDPHYLVRMPLATTLRLEIGRLANRASDLRVLDVGCSVKPYLPFFAGVAKTYTGLDTQSGPYVDVVSAAERIPFDGESFDVVLCTQVLEHVTDPDAVLSEIHRVLSPGGAALVSTHGVSLFHPDPKGSSHDYWRWTHAGLERVFCRAGHWTELSVIPHGNSVASVGYIIAQYVDQVGARLSIPLLHRLLLSFVNRTFELMDRHFPPSARVPAPGSMAANYLVTARKGVD